ncbi:MAG TPA: hypothetical protein VG501_02255 [Rhizomicrobium sp.]|nr:hypothetical protein [Rhizomicrobium sp.]
MTAPKPAPRILVISAFRWVSPAQAARVFQEAGAEVAVVCPPGHALEKLPLLAGVHHYSTFRPLESLRAAITAAAPDLLVPCDDLIASQLHKLHQSEAQNSSLKDVIVRSLGPAGNFPLVYSRVGLARLADELGVATPRNEQLPDREALQGALQRCGLPAVLKIDGSFGGRGVTILRTEAEAGPAFARLAAWPGWPRAIKHLLVNRDAALVRRMLSRVPNTLSLQRHVEGRLANAAVACWQGKVLAQVQVEVLKTDTPTGPATLVQVISHSGMASTVEKMVQRLNLSGLCGFDFILSAADGSAQFIELNPRATPTCHLVTADGQSLSRVLCAALRGDQTPPALLVPDLGPQILFPRTRRRSLRAARNTKKQKALAAALAELAPADPGQQ